MKRPVDAEAFIRTRRAALLSREACADLLGVTPRTLRNWEAGKVRIPYAAFRLLRLLAGGALPGEAWEGFYVRGNTLYSPNGKAFTAAELFYLENVFSMARFWLEDYHKRAARPVAVAPEAAAALGTGGRVIHMPGASKPGPVGNPANDAFPPSCNTGGKSPPDKQRVKDFNSLISILK